MGHLEKVPFYIHWKKKPKKHQHLSLHSHFDSFWVIHRLKLSHSQEMEPKVADWNFTVLSTFEVWEAPWNAKIKYSVVSAQSKLYYGFYNVPNGDAIIKFPFNNRAVRFSWTWFDQSLNVSGQGMRLDNMRSQAIIKQRVDSLCFLRFS